MLTSLFLSPPPDGVAGMLFFLSLVLGVVVFFGIVLVEAFILRWMDWESMWVSILDSFLVNLITTVLGILLAFYGDVSLSPRMWFMLWGMTVVIEGVLLYVVRRRSVQKTLDASLITNIVSYIGLYLVFPVFDYLI